MIHIIKLITTNQRRKWYILWLFVILLLIGISTPLFNSIALWQGEIVNKAFHHTAVEIMGLIYLIYFWSLVIKQFQEDKTLQLLRSKKKQPIQFLLWTRVWLYSIYAGFVVGWMIMTTLFYQGDMSIIASYLGLLISGAITLTFVYLFSFLTSAYAAMIASIIIVLVSHSLNFIIFSTPIAFETNLSFKFLTIIQYIFPRLDLLYHLSETRILALVTNLIYFVALWLITTKVFLNRIAK